jgi:hypothetical protein
MMIAHSRLTVTFDGIDTTTELAELAKLSGKTGADLRTEHYEDDNDQPKIRAVLTRTTPDFAVTDAAWLVYVQAMTRDQLPVAILDEVRSKLEALHVTLDVKPSDGPGIAE